VDPGVRAANALALVIRRSSIASDFVVLVLVLSPPRRTEYEMSAKWQLPRRWLRVKRLFMPPATFVATSLGPAGIKADGGLEELDSRCVSLPSGLPGGGVT
jgi:hypothetical protein